MKHFKRNLAFFLSAAILGTPVAFSSEKNEKMLGKKRNNEDSENGHLLSYIRRCEKKYVTKKRFDSEYCIVYPPLLKTDFFDEISTLPSSEYFAFFIHSLVKINKKWIDKFIDSKGRVANKFVDFVTYMKQTGNSNELTNEMKLIFLKEYGNKKIKGEVLALITVYLAHRVGKMNERIKSILDFVNKNYELNNEELSNLVKLLANKTFNNHLHNRSCKLPQYYLGFCKDIMFAINKAYESFQKENTNGEKVNEPKVEESKVEEPKVEEPKVEEPKVNELKVDEAKEDELILKLLLGSDMRSDMQEYINIKKMIKKDMNNIIEFDEYMNYQNFLKSEGDDYNKYIESTVIEHNPFVHKNEKSN